MILFYGEGRLGNQIFQYQALSQIAKPNEHIVSVGLEDLERSLELCGPKVTVLTRSGLLKRIIKYILCPLLLRPLARTLRLFNYGCEPSHGLPPNDGPSGELSIRVGLMPAITFVEGGCYQNAGFSPRHRSASNRLSGTRQGGRWIRFAESAARLPSCMFGAGIT
jgi:hypothetical protein